MEFGSSDTSQNSPVIASLQNQEFVVVGIGTLEGQQVLVLRQRVSEQEGRLMMHMDSISGHPWY